MGKINQRTTVKGKLKVTLNIPRFFFSLFIFFILFVYVSFFFQFSCSIVSTLFVLTFYVTIFCMLFYNILCNKHIKRQKNIEQMSAVDLYFFSELHRNDFVFFALFHQYLHSGKSSGKVVVELPDDTKSHL